MFSTGTAATSAPEGGTSTDPAPSSEDEDPPSNVNIDAAGNLVSVRPNQVVQEDLNNMYLKAAISVNSTKILTLLLETWALDANSRDLAFGRTVLHQAVLTENPQFVDILVKNNGSFALPDKKGRRFLQSLILNEGKKILSKKMLSHLLESGLDPNQADFSDKGYTAAHLAAELNQLAVLEVLLERPDFDANARTLDRTGYTPLFLSASVDATALLLGDRAAREAWIRFLVVFGKQVSRNS